MMNPAELAGKQVESTPESIRELSRDANTMVDDMITHVASLQRQLDGASGKRAEQLRRETDRLLASLAAARPGVVDMSALLKKQPPASDFRYPARADVLASEARKRLDKSKFMFPEPKAVLDAATILWDNADDHAELRLRIAYFLAKMNMVQDGLAVSAACRRLIQAAACVYQKTALTQEQTDLLAAAKASLLSFMYEARKNGSH